jgi:PhzF family phenazine biosynthesis protein
MSLEYQIVDAFASDPFHGNPAAVVFGGDELTDSCKQQIAAEFNLSETVFVLQPSVPRDKKTLRLRWFTPQCEVSFCGHATLAAVHAHCQRVDRTGEIDIECAAGNLVMKVESGLNGTRRYWLSMPRPDLQAIDFPANLLLSALQLPPDVQCQAPSQRTRDGDVIVLLAHGAQVRSLTPDMAALDQLSRQKQVRGVCVASTDTGDAHVASISRFFAPATGIPEDPVTGSVHGPLAALLIHGSHVAQLRPGQWSFLCRQLPRNGRIGNVFVRAESSGNELIVEVGGSCVTTMTGEVVAVTGR